MVDAYLFCSNGFRGVLVQWVRLNFLQGQRGDFRQVQRVKGGVKHQCGAQASCFAFEDIIIAEIHIVADKFVVGLDAAHFQ